MSNLPRFVALCGHPGVGKSEVQSILAAIFGYEPVDDGWCMRDFAIRHLGASIEDVMTQEGKARTVTLAGGQTMTWRKFLGEFGNRIEDLLGPDAIAEMAAMRCKPGKLYSFGSVRREQGRVFQRHGGVVVGIRRPGVGPSPHEFDRFNEELVDFWLDNDTDLLRLEHKVFALGEKLRAARIAA